MSFGDKLNADVRRGAGAAALALAAVAVLELVVSFIVAEKGVGPLAFVRFAALDVTLLALAALVVVPLGALVAAAPRLLRRTFDRPGAEAMRTVGDPAPAETGSRSLVPLSWALVVGAGAWVGSSYALTLAFRKFREPIVAALVLALVQLAVIGVLALLVALVTFWLRRAAARLQPRLGMWNPLGRPLPALLLAGAILAVAIAVLLRRAPMFRGLLPWRELLSGATFVVAYVFGARQLARRGRFWPADPRRRRVAIAAVALGFVILAPLTLWKIGADDTTKYLAYSASPTLSRLVDVVRKANDFDHDGYGSLLGENDCAPFDKHINPGARDIPDNGIDENCNGFDFTSAGLVKKPGELLPVPAQYQKKWNIMLVTIDALRYDKTGLGGYLASRKRNLTPNLDALGRRGVWFKFANAPSAGTMASIPSLLTSRYFHSGVAQKTPPGHVAPIVLPENPTIPMTVKKGGYFTAAILTHDYFGGNGMELERFFDSFDNSIGAKREPERITSQEVTDKATAWISRQGDKPWFLWLHYLDPHGRYMPHPGDLQFGDSEEDKYDGEIAYTDKHFGRLLDYLARSSQGQRTVIIVTSDHGEGFNEHGYINHGMTLYKEFLHVPLLIYIPDIEPHVVEGPVSVLDVLPTIADLAGVPWADLGIAGESLVPQLFYARDARPRVVFAETNYPEPIRAAVADDYKLIFNMKNNVYQLYDLRKDPWEKINVWQRDGAGTAKMKRLMDEWLDRVVFNRDAANEAQDYRSKVLLTAPPTPQTRVTATLGTAIDVLGWDASVKEATPGKPFNVVVYVKARGPAPDAWRFELEAMAPDATGAQLAARQEVVPVNGLYPTTRWRAGEMLKLEFTLKAAPTWQGLAALKLRAIDEKRQNVAVTGAVSADGKGVGLGTLPVAAPGR